MKSVFYISIGCLCLGVLSCSQVIVEQPRFLIVIFDTSSSINQRALDEGKTFVADRLLPLLRGGDKLAVMTISANSFDPQDSGQFYVLQSSPFYLDIKIDSLNAQIVRQAHQTIMSLRIQPKISASDILGSIAKASTYFNEDTLSEKVLIIISDLEENVWRQGLVEKIKLTGVRVYALFASHRFKGITDDFQAYQDKKVYWEKLLHSMGTTNSFIWDDDISRMKMDMLVALLEKK
ncbi:MAG: hypothetical protein WCT27_03535 [Patescibacteria group bacterium]